MVKKVAVQPYNLRAMKITRQREVIFEILKKNRNHPTALEIFDQAKKVLPDISLSTVYRTLKDMVVHGEVLEIKFEGESKARYDLNRGDDHAHFKCRMCGKVYDVSLMLPLDLVGFKVERVDVYIYGLCPDCAQKEVMA